MSTTQEIALFRKVRDVIGRLDNQLQHHTHRAEPIDDTAEVEFSRHRNGKEKRCRVTFQTICIEPIDRLLDKVSRRLDASAEVESYPDMLQVPNMSGETPLSPSSVQILMAKKAGEMSLRLQYLLEGDGRQLHFSWMKTNDLLISIVVDQPKGKTWSSDYVLSGESLLSVQSLPSLASHIAKTLIKPLPEG